MEKLLFLFKTKTTGILLPVLIFILSLGFNSVYAQPAFSMSFSPETIGPGNVSTLTFSIDNSSSGVIVEDLAFTNTLPAGVTIATPSNTSVSNITGTLSVPDGGSTITFSDGSIGIGEILTISVDVTSSVVATHINTTGDLTSSAGNSGSASDELTVSGSLPQFTMSFSPSTINLGERSTLTFFIDNSLNASGFAYIDFTDNLPEGMVIASPANASINFTGGDPTITPILTALPGSNLITYDGNGAPFAGFYALSPGGTCTISVDIIGNNAESIINEVELLADFNSCGNTTAVLEVLTPPEIFIQKSFSTNPVLPGATTNLEFTISNFSRNFAATNIAFTDDLDAVLSGLAATTTPLIDVCGTGSQISGTNELTLTGGSLTAEGSVSFSVPIQIPAGATPGEYTNTTSAITATIDGSTVTGNMATENLYISYSPIITKTFLDNPVLPGETATLEFTINNTSPTHEATNITFTDDISAFLSGATISPASLPAAGTCGAGSTFTIAGVDPWIFQMTNGTIAPGGSHTFTIDIIIPANTGGTYTNTTGFISATVNGNTTIGSPASDDLEVLYMPRLTKSFTDNPVSAGETATLEFSLTYSEFASGNAINISFTDDLDATLSGLTATGLPLNDVCGTGSQLSGTSTISLTGGSMSPGDSFTFTVDVDIPAAALPGTYTNTTSTLSATVGGLSGTSPAATDDLEIGGLTFTKEFLDDPVVPGDLVTLRYTIENETTDDATITAFTESLSSALAGLVAEAPLPNPTCGGGTLSAVSGNTILINNGGTVTAGNTCTIDVLCRVPLSAASGSYNSISSSLSATLDGNAVTIAPATDVLEINKSVIELTKSFTDDPVNPGSTVTLEYTLTNLDQNNAISNIAFTDDLDAALSGLEATGLPLNDVCGTGSTLSGTSIISLTGGSLAAGGSSTFTVTLQTPVSAPYGGSVTSITSNPTGEVNTHPVDGVAASDNLDFTSLQVTSAFASNVMPGEEATLTFILTNPDQVNPVTGIRFSNNLDDFISGATATNLPLNDEVGEGSTITGTSIILFNDGILDAGQTETFDVSIQIPCGTEVNTYSNATTIITANGNYGTYNIDPATASISIYDDFTAGSITSNQSICYNTAPEEIIGAEPTGSISPYTYQWQSSTDNVSFSNIDGAIGLNYQPGVLTTTTYYRLQQTSSLACDPIYSNTVTITVYSDFSVGSIAANQSICYNSAPSELTGTAPTGGSGSYTYQWQSSTDNISFTDIDGAVGIDYQPGSLTSTTYYKQKQTSSGSCGTLATNTITISVYDDFTVGSISEDQSICYNTSPAKLTGTAPTGGNTAYSYQWQSSTNNIDFINIGGANSIDYQPGSLTSTTYYRQVQSSGGSCGTLNTNTVTITVNDGFSVGSISDDQMICDAGIPDELIGVAPTGGIAPYNYQWQISLNDQDFVDINGATDLNYQPEEISETTYFRLKQISSCGEANTNSVEIFIHHLCCSEGTNSCQGPSLGQNDSYLSDVASNQQVFDNYSGILGPITNVQWWGSTVDGNDDYCDENPKSFVISFYTNNGGTVGNLINSYNVNATGIPAGASLDNGAPIMVYNYDLSPYLSSEYTEGWISIQGDPSSSCEFTWVTSPNGDGLSFIEGNLKSQSTEDFAFGLTYAPDIPLNNWGVVISAILMSLLIVAGGLRKLF